VVRRVPLLSASEARRGQSTKQETGHPNQSHLPSRENVQARQNLSLWLAFRCLRLPHDFGRSGGTS
jgi:hypothetical protein